MFWQVLIINSIRRCNIMAIGITTTLEAWHFPPICVSVCHMCSPSLHDSFWFIRQSREQTGHLLSLIYFCLRVKLLSACYLYCCKFIESNTRLCMMLKCLWCLDTTRQKTSSSKTRHPNDIELPGCITWLNSDRWYHSIRMYHQISLVCNLLAQSGLNRQ